VLNELGARTHEAHDAYEACSRAVRILEQNDADVPFALIYVCKRCR
jgi:hypothetical protein